VPAGQTLGLTGKNGAGKTTLIKLALGLYTPTSGRVTWDGLALSEWDRAALQTRTTAIFQDFVQYQLLAGENIGVGHAKRLEDEGEWQRAAQSSSADVAIERLPNRYLTQLGRWFEHGQELSLGEWQRVALARLFIHETAELFVLDEPTASLDPAAEELLVERLRERLAGKVALVASHRPAALRLAHQVIELERGRVVRATTP
jgi:ATP-binding cassette subfamily B protein